MQAMKRLQAFQFRLEPNGEQQRLMHQFAGCCRFVYNRALALQEERHAAGQPPLGYSKRCAVLKQWKADPDMVWLNVADSQILQQTLKDLGRAYTNFFEQRATEYSKGATRGDWHGDDGVWSRFDERRKKAAATVPAE